MQEADKTPWARRDAWIVLGLVIFSAGLRLWQIGNTEVTARDSIGFIRHAWQYHEAPLAEWPQLLRRAEQHPGYPLAVWAMSHAVRPVMGGAEVHVMQRSAQLTSALAAVLLVLPLYALGRELFERRVGVGVVLLVECLPLTGRILADGLSESLFLLFASAALFGAVRGCRHRSPAAFALCGLAGGLAYLTRPEGALIVAACGLVLLATLVVPAWRGPWGRTLACGGALAGPALAVALPFVCCVGHVTVKPTGVRILRPLPASPTASTAPRPGAPLLADWWHGEDNPALRLGWGGKVLVKQLVEGSFYVGWAAALLGFWWHRRLLREPAVWVPLLVSLAIGAAVWRVAVVLGYLSDRHALLILLTGSLFAVAGLLGLGERVLARRLSPERARAWAMILPLAFAASGIPRTAQTLHWHRAGFREVGLWLAENTHPSDEVDDPYCWSHYFSGRVFLEGQVVPVPAGQTPRTFIVLEDAGNPHPRLGARLTESMERARKGELVHRWTGRRGKREVHIEVWAVPKEPAAP